ncbi:MAG: Virulence transcriptional regulatory protein PhoP [Syntrophomonadaceae bacterium]|nr:Virulence transcriptional regulatory protein PhoP [Bacillota bacterium]
MKKVLVADSYDTACRHLSKALNEEGYQVVCARDNREFEEALDSTIDLILLGLEPDEQYFDIIRYAKNGCFAQVPLLVLARPADKQAVLRALAYGADDYIIKPVHDTLLTARLAQLLKMEQREKDTLTEYITFNCYELLELELKRAYRGKQSLSLLLISFLFPLKSGAGQLVSVLEGLLRDIDVVVRYSLHELLLILPMTGKDGALHVLGKVTRALDSLEYLTETTGYSRFVAAVATFPEDAIDKKGLFVRLEQQLRQKEL